MEPLVGRARKVAGWRKDGTFAGYSGQKGAQEVAKMLIGAVAGVDESTIRQLEGEL